MAIVDISPAKDGGVLKEIIKEGSGNDTPITGCKVTVHYTGTLLDGTKFDSSRDRKEPFTFDLGRGRVIKAWDIGIATMKKGEIAMLTCASEYAYGSRGSPPTIPPEAVLKFEIEMIDWRGEDVSPDQDDSIQKFQITPGKNYSDNPTVGSLVKIHLTGKYNDEVFEDRDVEFCLGEGEDVNIIEGVEIALESFKSGEKSKLKIKSKYAFKKEGKPEFNIPPDADVEYIVELKTFEKTKIWSLQAREKIEQAKLIKIRGTSFFKQNKYNLAINAYRRIFEYLNPESDFKGDEALERNSLLLSVHLNIALCYLKTNEYIKAKDSCNEALELQPENEKALFRRGQAYLALASPELAIKDFQEVLRIEPKNIAASNQVKICKNLIKAQTAKEKKLYANMFEKFAQEDKQ